MINPALERKVMKYMQKQALLLDAT